MSTKFNLFANAVSSRSIQYIRGTENDLKYASWDKIDVKAEVFDDEKACLCPPVIRCVNVQTQNGYIVAVRDLKQVKWKSTAIEKLVLDAERKRMLLRLIRYHLSNKQKDEGDLISHKGNGLIVVLHGPPGNGKSFAAESIAEHFQTPLIAMSIGDLIADQRNIEDRLEKVFKVASKWQSVLLVDEADVVLEARSIEDVRRNAIVSGKFPALNVIIYH
jgi:AAA+ superfamily predicted ATPase